MRRKDREITDIEEIRSILDNAKTMHLGINDGKRPYIVPLHYAYEFNQANGSFTFYAHSAQEGRKLDLIAADPNVFVEIDCGMSLISGGDIACRYGAHFSSFMGGGAAGIVTEPSEKVRALRLLMRQQTGRDFDIDAEAASMVAVIRIGVETYTVKANR